MLIRTYKAKRQSDAIKKAQKEAARDGLTITNMSWQEGKAGCLRFLLIGPFAFFVRPDGELTVTLSNT